MVKNENLAEAGGFIAPNAESLSWDSLIGNALNTIGPNSVPEQAGIVYGLLAIAQQLKRANDFREAEIEREELRGEW